MDSATRHLIPMLCSCDMLRELGIPHGGVIDTRKMSKHYKPDLFLPGNQMLNNRQCAADFEDRGRWAKKDG